MIKGQFRFHKDKKDFKEDLFYYFLRILFILVIYFGYRYYDDPHAYSNSLKETYYMMGGKEDIDQFIKDKTK